jgi:acetyl-CoA carboxylase biotin carboxyl carrier protein
MSGEGLTELEVEDKEAGLQLKLRRGDARDASASAPVLQMLPGAMGAMPGQMPLSGIPQAGAPAAAGEGNLPPGIVTVDSPMVGTFYRSTSPDSDPLVEVGTRIDDEKVVCIVEAMKVMNEIKAEIRGEVTEILVADGEPVEFGQPMFLVKKG